jgi:hypothetical protein
MANEMNFKLRGPNQSQVFFISEKYQGFYSQLEKPQCEAECLNFA